LTSPFLEFCEKLDLKVLPVTVSMPTQPDENLLSVFQDMVVLWGAPTFPENLGIEYFQMRR
jgi:hypothetical protein